MPVLFTNNASTTLSAGINNSTTTIPIASASGFPSLGSGEYYFGTIANTNNTKVEVVKVTAGTTSLTVTRAQDGTSAQAFDSGDNFQLRVTAATLDATRKSDVAITACSVSADTLIAKGDGSSADGQIQLNCSQNSHGIKLKSPPHSASASYTLTFPNDDGTNGQKLTTNGSGVLTWTADTDTVYTHPNHSGDVTSSADGATTIASNAVTTAKIADANVTTAKIADANVTTAKLAADAVTGAKIADDAIDSEHYVDGSIDTAHIAGDAVTSAKIANGAISSSAKIANDVIDSQHYADGSIDTAHIGDSQDRQ